MKGICNLSLIPVRSEPSERSEMVTQILFGEMYSILDEKENWLLISCQYDDYEGWIDKKMSFSISDEYANKMESLPMIVVNDVVSSAHVLKHNTYIHLVKGSLLPAFHEPHFETGVVKYSFEGNCAAISAVPDSTHLEDIALSYLNMPYLWGGRSPFGIDCSGFTQMVFRSCGIRLRRDAGQQVNQGEIVSFIFEALPGDLAFFDNSSGAITHVGIILNGGRIIHSSGKVRIDNIDHNGIFNQETGKYTHNLRIIKRVFPI